MKTTLSVVFFVLLTLTSAHFSTVVASTATAQNSQTGGFNFFRAHRQASGIALSWSTASPDVVAFKVERSYDGDFFDTINDMPCNGGGMHKFSDMEIFPGTIHYRITAVKADGTTEVSSIEMVRIVKRG
jgi:hypothetical protein